MAFLCRWLLIFSALILGGTPVFAASARENRAYAAAASAFQDEMWSRAETEFAQFAAKYPKSTNAPEAVLMQAQAEFQQGKFVETIALLSARKTEAGKLADQYVYWIGESQFKGGNFSAAAETFISLAQNFPESSLRLRAVVEAAAARAQLNQWPQVIVLLEEPGGVFSRAVQVDSANEFVSRGRLLLAQAKFAQKNLNGALAILQLLSAQPLKTELDWQRAYLLCQIKLATGDLPAALAVTTNLTQIARLEKDDDSTAESVALRADILEKLNRANEAMASYQENLTNSAPVERQRQAVLKIAELAIAQNQFSVAEQALEKFLAKFPGSAAADVALLTLGELHLKDYAAQPSATNHLQQASALFNQFLDTFTNSPLLGKAFLDRGWCEWLTKNTTNSLADFQSAANLLPLSEDLAVAKFKMGDAMFVLTNYAGALENYRAVLDDFTNFPQVKAAMGSQALYQILRASLKLNNMDAASNAMARILKIYPANNLADKSLLLVGEGYEDLNQPAVARALFQNFERQSPDSQLHPQVEMAIARTYELEGDWSAAIRQYEDWLKFFPTNALLSQVEYARARANFQSGNETNAFVLFTNFVAQFPTNELAPQAQWWVADYYFRASDPDHFVNAERNYKFIFQNTNWQGSPLENRTNLFYPAQMMAARAAVGRLGYSDAIGYFTGLVGDTNCPPDLNAQARFAWGATLMQMNSSDTNSPLANFQLATNVFAQIVQMYPTNELSALAWGEIGDCDLQLTNFDAATNAYAQVANSPFAKIAARSQAQIGWGIALEKKAASMTGNDQTNSLQLALNNYLDVLYGKNLRDDETPDAFWTKKAGLQAAALTETLGEWPQAVNIYQRLEKLLPQLKDSLEKKIAAAQENFPPPKN